MGSSITFALDRSAPWTSATFVGEQLWVTVTGLLPADWLAALPDADLPVPGGFVASCAVEPTPTGATLILLVLDD
jgi:hypothetical protein